ncbi:MAG: hypothetical protein ACREBF_02475 [Candidatus Micrarchaeales archaeon]
MGSFLYQYYMYYFMERTLTVRRINTKLRARLKARAAARRMSVGEALNQAIEFWLKEENKESKKDIKELLKFKPIDFGSGSENLSLRIDEIIYGGSK